MKKNTIQTAVLIALLSLAGYSVKAQNKELKVGTNPTIKEPSAVLEVESANKGALLPRVALTGLEDVTTIANPANALTVFNTATTTTGTNDVSPGYYYWNTTDSKWVRLLDNPESLKIEPWQIQTTTDKATANTDNIYQMGTVAIGKNEVQNNVVLDVEGATRLGSAHVGNVGTNSVAIGTGNTASGTNSFAGGSGTVASGEHSFAFGENANASALNAIALGAQSNASGDYGLALGAYAEASEMGVAVGIGAKSTAPDAIALSTTAIASGRTSVALGTAAESQGTNSVAIGSGTIAASDDTIAIGTGAEASDTFGIAIGSNTSASIFALGIGFNAQATGANSVVLSGGSSSASGQSSMALGHVAVAEGLASAAIGQNSNSKGNFSLSLGSKSTAYSAGEMSLGKGTAYVPVSTTDFEIQDRLLNIGSGYPSAPGSDSDALTILKSGNTGIGFNNFETTTFNEKLQVNGNARFATLPSVNGDIATDKVVVADADGVLKTVPSSSFSNIYTANGALAGDRTVDLNTNSLTFQGNEGYLNIESGGNYMSLHADNPDRSHFRMSTQDVDNDGVISLFDMDLFSDNYMQINASGEMNRMIFGTNATQNSSSIEFVTSSGAFASGMPRMVITGEGNIGVDDFSPDERLVIGSGNVRIDDINDVANQGDVSTDRIVVANADGVLKTVPVSSLGAAIRTENGDYTALDTDETILVDASAGAVTIELPAAPTVGKRYNVKKIDNTANAASVTGNGNNIDGNATVSGTLPYQGWVMQFDGNNWFIISRI